MTSVDNPIFFITTTATPISGSIGSSSEIEASTDLAGWTSLGTVTNTTRTVRFADPDASNHQQRFYRAIAR
jgi:hypothetical protein